MPSSFSRCSALTFVVLVDIVGSLTTDPDACAIDVQDLTGNWLASVR